MGEKNQQRYEKKEAFITRGKERQKREKPQKTRFILLVFFNPLSSVSPPPLWKRRGKEQKTKEEKKTMKSDSNKAKDEHSIRNDGKGRQLCLKQESRAESPQPIKQRNKTGKRFSLAPSCFCLSGNKNNQQGQRKPTLTMPVGPQDSQPSP